MAAADFKTLPQAYPMGMRYVLKFDSTIEEPEYYSYFCDVLSMANEEDYIEMYFSTPGGNGDTMITLMNLMDMCKAHIHGILTSSASSAGSYLFLKCDTHTVGKHCSMLCHQVSYGIGGSHHEIRSFVDHMEAEEKGLVEDVYSGFLSEDEKVRLMRGEQIHIRSDEIVSRLENRAAFLEEQQLSDEQEAIAEFEEMFAPPPDKLLNGLTKKDLIRMIKGEIGVDEDGNIVELEDE